MVLMVGLVLAILAGSTHAQALFGLRQTNRYGANLEARYAAQAGFQVALSELKRDENFAGPVDGSASYDPRLTYHVEVLNNATGVNPLPAPDGSFVPPGAVALTATAGRSPQLIVMSALVTREGSAPPFQAVFASSGIDMSMSSTIRPWGSVAAPIQIGTNVVGGGDIELSMNSEIQGDVLLGPGGDPATAVDLAMGSSISGSITAATTATVLAPQAPPPVTPPLASVDVSMADKLAIPPGAYSSIDVSTGSQLTLSSGVYYVDHDFELSLGTSLKCDITAGPVELYIGGDFDAASNSQINVAGPPDNLRVYLLGSSPEVELSSNSTAHMVVYGPGASLDMSTNSTLIGAFVGDRIEMSMNSRLLFDTSLAGSTPATPGNGRWILSSQKVLSQ